MARRSDHSRDELINLALTAGDKLLEADGFAGFSARKLARHIGYSVGTLYNIFGNLDEMMLRLNARTLEDLKNYLVKETQPELKGREHARYLAHCYLKFARSHPNRWSALFEHPLAPDAPLPEWYSEKIAELFAHIEASLLPLCDDSSRAHSLAKTLWAAIHGICALGLTHKLPAVGATSVENLIDDLIDTFFDGLGTTISQNRKTL